MKKIVSILITLCALSSSASAQNALAGTSLRLVPETTKPSNLIGRAGMWNHGGIYTWSSTGNVDGQILQCPTCTTNVLPYVSSSSVTSPSDFFYDATDKQFCGGAASGSYCIRLDASLAIASIGFHIGIADGNYVQNDVLGTKIYHNGLNFAQTIGSGANEEWRVNGAIHSQQTGFIFPDGSTQITAAVTSVVQEVFSWYDLAQLGANVGTVCGASRPPFIVGFTAANRQYGITVAFPAGGTATGIRFYTASGATETDQCLLWESNANTPVVVASGTVNVTGAGQYTCTFTATWPLNRISEYWAMVFAPSGISTFGGCTTSATNNYYPNGPYTNQNQMFAAGPHYAIWGGYGMKSSSAAGTGAAGTPSLNTLTDPVPVTLLFTVP